MHETYRVAYQKTFFGMNVVHIAKISPSKGMMERDEADVLIASMECAQLFIFWLHGLSEWAASHLADLILMEVFSSLSFVTFIVFSCLSIHKYITDHSLIVHSSLYH